MHPNIVHDFHEANVNGCRAQYLGGTVHSLGDDHAHSSWHIVLERSLERRLDLTMEVRSIVTGIGYQVTSGREFVTTVGSFHDVVDVNTFVFRTVVVFRDALSVAVARGIDFSFVPSCLDLGPHQCLWLLHLHLRSVERRNTFPPNKRAFHHDVVIGIIRLEGLAAFDAAITLEGILHITTTDNIVGHASQKLLRLRDALPTSFQFLATAREASFRSMHGIGGADDLRRRGAGMTSGRKAVGVEARAFFGRIGHHHDALAGCIRRLFFSKCDVLCLVG
mmetsp:Transcript_13797/g.24951  ORF Transcript_13797/g.24951 Transcript_13797/m.24951 type:complete len:278 (-) Transcript_13797:361-1194(-)